ncbi:MAG: hypothetical protein ACR2QM_03590, partial [Longimicrobiales bacterium]
EWGSGPLGWRSVVRLEEFVEATLGRGNVVVPDDGLPGPQQVRLTDDIRLVAMNTEWLLRGQDRPTGEVGDYEVTGDDDFYVELEDIVAKRSGEDLIVVGHHPLRSNGPFGGHHPPKTHLFPLTMAWNRAYVPLPILGTLAVAVRGSLGSEQHFANRRNEWMRENVDRRLLEHEDFVYVSAHDQSLQLHESGSVRDMQKYVVTGSAAETDHVSGGHDAEWVFEQRGFVSLHYYRQGAVWADAWGVDPQGSGRLLQETELRASRLALTAEPNQQVEATGPSYADSTKIVIPEPAYAAGWLREFTFGANRRDVWLTPIEVPYLDLSREHGGLTPVKRGGGMQTTSIRLEDPLGRQYVLRSVNKDAQRSLPEEWRSTLAAPISQDLLSKGHPHAAIVVPPLAEAVGVFHTNPRLVWVPPDERLGIYRDLVGDMLMLFEERPSGDMSHAPSFGRAEDVVSAATMYRNVTRDNDDRVDARAYARARLFDMWISDWDRHKDQWRWAAFEDPDGRGTLYRPVPRDRDQAFLKMDFFLSGLIKPFIKFQDYREGYGNIKGLTQNATEQDHRFLAPLGRADWVAIADSVREALTDEVIEAAFQGLPGPVFDLHGEELIAIARVRRDKLAVVAEEFYELHSRSVDVVGSNRHETFEVTRVDDESTRVVVYKSTREGEPQQEIFRRVFAHDETDELALYGLGGDDRFVVTGQVREGVTIHAVGGTGEDHFRDDSEVEGRARLTHFLDSRESDWSGSDETRVEVGRRPEDSDYTGHFQYPRTYPAGAAWYNKDDGFVLAGAALLTSPGFQKEPFSRTHRLSGSLATGTGAIRLGYSGTAREALGDWDAGLDLRWANQDNTYNFYGLGNETAPAPALDLVRIRLGQIEASLPLIRESETGLSLGLIPRLTMTDVRDDQRPEDFPQ